MLCAVCEYQLYTVYSPAWLWAWCMGVKHVECWISTAMAEKCGEVDTSHKLGFKMKIMDISSTAWAAQALVVNCGNSYFNIDNKALGSVPVPFWCQVESAVAGRLSLESDFGDLKHSVGKYGYLCMEGDSTLREKLVPVVAFIVLCPILKSCVPRMPGAHTGFWLGHSFTSYTCIIPVCIIHIHIMDGIQIEL